MLSAEKLNILNCSSSCSINPLLSWSSILKTFSISDGVFLDRPRVAKNVFGLKESLAENFELENLHKCTQKITAFAFLKCFSKSCD